MKKEYTAQAKEIIAYLPWNFFKYIPHLYPEYTCLPLHKVLFQRKNIRAIIGFKKGGSWIAKLLKLPFWNVTEGLYRLSGQKPCSFLIQKNGDLNDAREASDWEACMYAIPHLVRSFSQKESLEFSDDVPYDNAAFIQETLHVITQAFPVLAPYTKEQIKEYLDSLLNQRLSSDRYAPDAPPFHLYTPGGRKRIVIIDEEEQSERSLKKVFASAKSFPLMLEKAKKENPGAAFFLLEPKSVRNNKKKGYLRQLALASGVQIINSNVSTISILSQAEKVYTVASPLGIDAIFLGKSVHCIGMPYYAGFGLSHDMVQIDRRAIKRSKEELFAALCLFSTRYRHPITGEASSFQEVLRFIILQRPPVSEINRYIACIHFDKKQEEFAKCFLGHADAHFLPEEKAIAEAKAHKGMVFSRIEPDINLQKACKGVPLVFVQRGILDRLLEQEKALSWSLTGGSYPSLERILQTKTPTESQLLRARFFRQYLRELSAKREHFNPNCLEKGKDIVILIGNADIVPELSEGLMESLQASNSAKHWNITKEELPIYSFASPLSNDKDLILHIRDLRPEAYIVYCPQNKGQVVPEEVLKFVDEVRPFAHPSDFIPLTELGLAEEGNLSDVTEGENLSEITESENKNPTGEEFDPNTECLAQTPKQYSTKQLNAKRFLEKAHVMTTTNAHFCPLFLPIHEINGHKVEVHTYDSFLGLEGLALCMDVYTYGWPIYAGWGLTKDASTFPMRTQPLSVDSLLAGALIIQPRYFDSVNKIFCEPENTPFLLARDNDNF